MTQRDLALAVNVGERFIVELENGKPTCQLGKALAVAKCVGIRLTDTVPAPVLSDEGLPAAGPDDAYPDLRFRGGCVNTLPICYENLVVGTIAFAGDGPSFAYDPRWPKTRGAFPVSLGMPLGKGPFGPGTLLPWLANLPPEEGNLLAVGRNLGVSPRDAIGNLVHVEDAEPEPDAEASPPA